MKAKLAFTMSLLFLAACNNGESIESAPAAVEIAEPAGGQADAGGDAEGSAEGSSAAAQDSGDPSTTVGSGVSEGSTAGNDQNNGAATLVDVEASTTDVVLGSADAEMSGNPRRPESGWGTLTIDRAYSTLNLDGNEASGGRKFVAVQFQLLGGQLGTLWQSAFRLQADGEWYSPAHDFNAQYEVGEVLNGTVVFSVPRDVAGFTLEGGVPEGADSGRTASFDFSLSPSTAPGGGSAATDDGTALLTDDAQMSGNPRRPDSGWGTLTIDRASSATSIDGNEAGEGRVYVAVEFQLLGGELGTLWQSAFRLQADGEWYSPVNDFNVQYESGEVLNGTVVFAVPRTASAFVLEGGSTDGRLAAYSLTVE